MLWSSLADQQPASLEGVESRCLAPPFVSDSAIWDPSVRDTVSLEKMPEWQLNRLRSQNDVPGKLLNNVILTISCNV